MFHGKGIYSWGDGREFKGYFVENNITGLGVLTYKNGEFYEGELRLGQEYGHGVLAKGSSVIFAGAWVSGQQVIERMIEPTEEQVAGTVIKKPKACCNIF